MESFFAESELDFPALEFPQDVNVKIAAAKRIEMFFIGFKIYANIRIAKYLKHFNETYQMKTMI